MSENDVRAIIQEENQKVLNKLQELIDLIPKRELIIVTADGTIRDVVTETSYKRTVLAKFEPARPQIKVQYDKQ